MVLRRYPGVQHLSFRFVHLVGLKENAEGKCRIQGTIELLGGLELGGNSGGQLFDGSFTCTLIRVWVQGLRKSRSQLKED